MFISSTSTRADLTPDVLAPVQGRDVKIAAVVLGTLGGPALRVPLKQVKFTFRAHTALVTCIRQTAQGPAQDMPSVRPVGASVRRAHTAEKTHPRLRLRPLTGSTESVAASGNRNRSGNLSTGALKPKMDDASKETRVSNARELAGHDGDIFQRAHHIAERQSDELARRFPPQTGARLASSNPLFSLRFGRAVPPPCFYAGCCRNPQQAGKARPVRAARCYE